MSDKDILTELWHEGRDKEHSSNNIGSGRYPVGSGKVPFQHDDDEFRSTLGELKKRGFTDKEICDYFGISSTELRARRSMIKMNQHDRENAQIKAYLDAGMKPAEIKLAMGMGRNFYNRLNEVIGRKEYTTKVKMDEVIETLKSELDTKRYLDVGNGVENFLGVSSTKLNTALKALQDEGYEVFNIKLPQMTNPRQKTTIKILAQKGTSKQEVWNHLDDVKSVEDFTPEFNSDKDITAVGIVYPKSIDMSRVYIRYPDDPVKDGGKLDGTIELRRGVKDISLGDSNYAQVRIGVDDKYYLKGVAVYRDDIPDGYDVVFNTSKTRDMPIDKVLKPFKTTKDPETGKDIIDRDNPFGATIKKDGGQSYYEDENGKKQLSLINKVQEEGDWGEWSKSLSSQFLSKQSMPLIKRQLGLSYEDKVSEYKDILSIENSVVKKNLLEGFADDCDSSAVHLKAAALPRQASKLILPVTSLKPGTVYAQGYENGTKCWLIRYPHAAVFEIPELIVDNRNKEGRSLIGNSQDAIGINYETAAQLSGADFDGDTVVLIPESKDISIIHSPVPQDIKIFSDTFHDLYKAYDGMPKVKDDPSFKKQKEMGTISNLITDMTLKGAPEDEIVKAVKHSMVIIDAEKHNLDWRRSYEENDIKELSLRWQGKARGGASTLISMAKGRRDDYERKQVYPESDWDPDTGEVHYRLTGRTINKVAKDIVIDPETGKKIKVDRIDPETGKKVYYDSGELAKERHTKMELAKDAFTLSSGTPQETEYAIYANKLKALANEARKSYLSVENYKTDIGAKKIYSDEVASLEQKLLIAKKNAPRERQAQVIATIALKAKTKALPELTDDEHKSELKRTKAQLLTGARDMVGASKTRVRFTEEEWEAVEAHAISPSMLKDLLNNADMDTVKKMAMPHRAEEITDAKRARIRALELQGFDLVEIANKVNLNPDTVSDVLSGKRS